LDPRWYLDVKKSWWNLQKLFWNSHDFQQVKASKTYMDMFWSRNEEFWGKECVFDEISWRIVDLLKRGQVFHLFHFSYESNAFFEIFSWMGCWFDVFEAFKHDDWVDIDGDWESFMVAIGKGVLILETCVFDSVFSMF
jgi:hypothetical protein